MKLAAIVVFCLASLGLAEERHRYMGARDLVARVQSDLKRAADFAESGAGVKSEKEIDRFRNAEKSLSDFDRNLTKGKFDKGDLDKAIGDIKNVLDHNTLSSEDRDALTADLRELRGLRAEHG